MRVGADDGERVVVAALDAGARLLDTANVYFGPGGRVGDNERLVSSAVRRFCESSGVARADLTIATKGGMTRRGNRWIPDGKAKSIAAACEASLVALDEAAIDLYLLHAPDPNVSIKTSARALAELKAAGLANQIGVCNVNRTTLEEALSVCDLDAVQIALSPLDQNSVRGGVVDLCRERGLAVIAHSPLGGPKARKRLAKLEAVAVAAEQMGVSVEEATLAWLASLGGIAAIPGASRVETARASVLAQGVALDPSVRAIFDSGLDAGPLLATTRAQRRANVKPDGGDVVVLMGSQGAGKSTLAREFVDQGYVRLNRDKRGGTLAGLIGPLEQALAAGKRVVLDNTYASRSARNLVIEAAWRCGAEARCIFVDTPIEEAQINAVLRMLRANGGALPTPEEIKKRNRKSPLYLPPNVLFRYRRELEPPREDEGFASVEVREFARTWPARKQRALFVEIDGVLRRTKSGAARPLEPADVEVIKGRGDKLEAMAAEGWTVLGISWQPEIESGEVTRDVVRACFDRMQERLGIEFPISVCPHQAGPPRCWCRKPLPGLGVELIERHKIDPARSTFVGRNKTDKLFAERLGLDYRTADEFF